MPPTIRRVAAVVFAATFVAAAVSGTAAAHVTVEPEVVEGGSQARVDFQVPNESESADTVKLEVHLPQDEAFASVRTMPVPGWSVETETVELDEPIEVHGREVDEAVATITWTADSDDDAVGPGEFAEFPVTLGPLPEEGEVVFKAIQTYSDGEEVAWIDEPEQGAEPLEPAPVLTVAADSDDETATDPGDSGVGLAVTLSGVATALALIALAAAVIALRGTNRQTESEEQT